MSKTNDTAISKIHPAPGLLLVLPNQAAKQTTSGIYLPESHDEKPQQGTILAVGESEITEHGTKKSPAPKDAVIIYKKWGGNEVKIDDKEYLFVKFDDVLAIVTQ